MKRLALVVILAVMVSLAISTGVLAATLSKTVPATVTVVDYVPGLEVYADEAGTVPLTGVSFGSLHRGQTSQPQTFYVKNSGELALSNVTVTTTAIIGTLAVTGNGVPLAVGETAPISVTLTPSATALFQTYTISLTVGATY